MSCKELLDGVRALTPVEKLKLVHELVEDLARSPAPTAMGDVGHAVWSPYDAHDAARALEAVLDKQ